MDRAMLGRDARHWWTCVHLRLACFHHRSMDCLEFVSCAFAQFIWWRFISRGRGVILSKFYGAINLQIRTNALYIQYNNYLSLARSGESSPKLKDHWLSLWTTEVSVFVNNWFSKHPETLVNLNNYFYTNKLIVIHHFPYKFLEMTLSACFLQCFFWISILCNNVVLHWILLEATEIIRQSKYTCHTCKFSFI